MVVQRTNTSLLSNSTIVFTFDSGSYDASQLSNVTCSPVCTKSNLSLLFFASLFVSSPTLFKISIGNVTNPPSTKAPGYSYKLLDGSNNTLESNLILPSSFIAGTFKCKRFIMFSLPDIICSDNRKQQFHGESEHHTGESDSCGRVFAG